MIWPFRRKPADWLPWPPTPEGTLQDAIETLMMGEACCQACFREIIIDVLVDTDLWREISPTGDEGGLLCAACIADQVAKIRSGRTWAALRMISANI